MLSSLPSLKEEHLLFRLSLLHDHVVRAEELAPKVVRHLLEERQVQVAEELGALDDAACHLAHHLVPEPEREELSRRFACERVR